MLESLNDNGMGEWRGKIREVLLDHREELIAAEMLDKFDAGEWKLGKQELFHLDANSGDAYQYLQYRFRFWYSLNRPNMDEVPLFPVYLGVEPTSVCNLKCKMCWQQGMDIRSAPYRGKMDFSTFKKIVDEASENGCQAITLAGRGEPLMNPGICDFLDYAANKFFELKINTNGLLLSEKVSHAILRANVAIIVFSAEGTTQEEYEITRCGGDFSKLIENIKRFNDIKKNYYPQNRTQTRVSGVIVDKAMDKNKYYDFWRSYVDEVALVELEDRWDTYNNEVALACIKPCHRLWHQMYIWWDGSCSVCDNDYLSKLQIGKIGSNVAIRDIWNGDRYNEIRNMHRRNCRGECIPCDRCGL